MLSELSVTADISEQTAPKLTASRSRYRKRHCQVQQLCHRHQIIHPWNTQCQAWALHINGGNSASKQTAPFCVTKVPHESVTSQHPTPSSQQGRSVCSCTSGTLWRAQAPALGPLPTRLEPCTAIMLCALSIIKLPQPQNQRKTSKIGLEITASQPQILPAPLPYEPSLPHTLQSSRLSFDEHTGTSLLPPCPRQFTF